MTPEEIKLHLAYGRYYGRESTCGKKMKHDSFEKADRHAFHHNYSGGRHNVEPYPCYWCSPDVANGVYSWHVGRAMTDEEKAILTPLLADKILEMEEVQLNVAERQFGIELGERTLRVHNRKLCAGQFCTIHNPSDHHMKDWPMTWRGDRGIMERSCTHGIGHPDPDDAAYRRRRDGANADQGIHGCDGCCRPGGN